MKNTKLSVEIMLVEDNPGDIRLITELFKESDIENQVNVASDGEQALMMLQRRKSSPPCAYLILFY